MPLYIKDDATAELVDQLAKRWGMSKQDTVKTAVKAELKRASEAVPLTDRLIAWQKANPMPPPTGRIADKAFFDELSGEP